MHLISTQFPFALVEDVQQRTEIFIHDKITRFIIGWNRHTLAAGRHFEYSAHVQNTSPLLGEIGDYVSSLSLLSFGYSLLVVCQKSIPVLFRAN